jgi:DNA invertase Pin-like site-specific DNA recombinase
MVDDCSEVVAWLNSLPKPAPRNGHKAAFSPGTSSARCYLRVSTDEQENGLEAQRQAVLADYERHLKPKGYLFGGLYVDEATSGKRRLADRPEGARLAGELERGDVAVFAKLDRGFRSAADVAMTLEVWSSRSVDLRILDMPFGDTTNPVGKAMLQIAGVFAELERRKIAERTSEALQVLRRKGRPYGPPPHGFKIKRKHDARGKVIERYFVRDEHERYVGGVIVDWRTKGYSWSQIYIGLLENRIKNSKGGEWSEGAIKKACAAELRLRAYEAQSHSVKGN